MNDIGHFLVSAAKSLIRILGCAFALCTIGYGEVHGDPNCLNQCIYIMAGSMLLAELLGILEEVVDKR